MDITNIDIRKPVVNSDTNLTHDNVYKIDFSNGTGASGTHDIAVIPCGEAVVNVDIACVDKVSGTGTISLKVDGSAIGSAVEVSSLSKGSVTRLGGCGKFSLESAQKLQLVVSASVSSGGLLAFVSTIPVKSYTTNG